MSAVVAFVNGVQDVFRVIRLHIIVALDVAILASRRRLWEFFEGLLGLEVGVRSFALML